MMKTTIKQKKKQRKIILLEPVKPSEEFMQEKWKKEIDDPVMQKFNLVGLFLLVAIVGYYSYLAIFVKTDVGSLNLTASALAMLSALVIVFDAVYLTFKFLSGKKQGSPFLAFKDPTLPNKSGLKQF